MLAGLKEERIAWDDAGEEEIAGDDFAELAQDVPTHGFGLIDHCGQETENFNRRFSCSEGGELMKNLREGAQGQGSAFFDHHDLLAEAEDVTRDAVGATGGVDQGEIVVEIVEVVEHGVDLRVAGIGIGGEGRIAEGVELAGGQQVEVGETRLHDEGIEGSAEEGLEESGAGGGVLGEGKPDRALGIGIDQEDAPTPLRQGMREIDGGGGFTDASLLAGDADPDHKERISTGPNRSQGGLC